MSSKWLRRLEAIGQMEMFPISDTAQIPAHRTQIPGKPQLDTAPDLPTNSDAAEAGRGLGSVSP